MTNPIVYNQFATATLQGSQIIQQQQMDILLDPQGLSGLNAGTNYRLADALPMLPVGPLRNSALLLSQNPDAVFSYRLVTTNGQTVPQYSFRSATDVVPVEDAGPLLVRTGGPGGNPSPGGSGIVVNLGGTSVIIGANILMHKAGVPAPLAGPVLGGSFALADVFTGMPAAPANQFFRNSFASMGVGTATQYGFTYGLDAVGVPIGSDANTALSIGGTVVSFAPAIESFGVVANPIYSQTYANAFRSAIGVGLAGGSEGSAVFLASGGPAGGAGLAGGGMQALGAVGAVFMGSQLGGWITEQATGMNDANDPYGQLARLSYERMRSDAFGALGRSPLGHLMTGLATLFCGADDVAEGLGYAEQSIVRDARNFTDSMDTNLIAFLMRSSSANPQEAMPIANLEQGIRNFYSDNSSGISSAYRVINILRGTYKLNRDEGGMTRFVDVNGNITDRAAFNAFAADAAQRAINSRTNRLQALYQANGLVIRDGRVAPATGTTFTQEQIDFIRGPGSQIAYEIVRLTNALETLRPSATALN